MQYNKEFFQKGFKKNGDRFYNYLKWYIEKYGNKTEYDLKQKIIRHIIRKYGYNYYKENKEVFESYIQDAIDKAKKNLLINDQQYALDYCIYKLGSGKSFKDCLNKLKYEKRCVFDLDKLERELEKFDYNLKDIELENGRRFLQKKKEKILKKNISKYEIKGMLFNKGFSTETIKQLLNGLKEILGE